MNLKNRKLSFYITLLMLSFASVIKASDFKEGALYYTILSEDNAICRVDKAPSDAPYSGDIVVPETVTHNGKTYAIKNLDSNPFEGCGQITSIRIDSKLTTLPTNAFMDCSNLSEVILPETLKTTGIRAFYRCSNLSKVILPETLESISESAFAGCSNLESINLPKTLKHINFLAFSGCVSLNSIVLPDSLETISEKSFQDCKSLTSITIPEKVAISDNVFYGGVIFSGCSSLTNVTLKNEELDINRYYTFMDCTSLKEIIMPKTIKSIGEGCYSGCTSIENIALIDDIELISRYAFQGCTHLKSIGFGKNLRTIGDKAFDLCYDISTIKCKNSTPSSFKNSAFTDVVYNTATVTVPWGSLELYRNCEGWKNFKNIVEDTEVIEPRTITFNNNHLEMIEGDTLSVEALILPANASFYRVQWDAPEELEIKDASRIGNTASCSVIPRKKGVYILTAKCLDEKTDELICQNVCVVNVKENIPPTEIVVKSLNPVLVWNQVFSFIVTVNPEDFTGDYYFALSDKSDGLEHSMTHLFDPNDPHQECQLSVRVTKIGRFTLTISLIDSKTDKVVLTKDIEVETATAGASFNSVEGKIETYTGSEGLMVSINANEGYKVHSVMLDGNDVSSQFAGGVAVPVTIGSWSNLPAFDIVYEKIEDSALDITENDNFKLLQHGNMIEIIGANDENSPVTVYDDMGRVVEHTNSHSITLYKKGVYILTVEGHRFKFIIKD